MNFDYYKKFEPIDGKWYINKELGRGAFGTVLEVERRDRTNMKAAIKIVSVPSAPNEVDSYREEHYTLDEQTITAYFYGFVEEFVSEFQLMAELRGHTNIVNIEDYEVKERKDEFGWDIFIRMELLSPMNKYFAKNAPGKKDVVRLGIDICKALEVCQKHNIIHRDIKPSNIFISENGDFKLGDFGVARTLEKTSSGLSKKGTYIYMAPEVYLGTPYGANVDLYSLGIVMYKMLNDNFEPFRTQLTHSDEEEAMAKRFRGDPVPKPKHADGKLAEIILKACCFDPAARYRDPREMREDLEKVLHSLEADSAPKAQEPIQVPINKISKSNEMTQGVFAPRNDAPHAPVGSAPKNGEMTQGVFAPRNTVPPQAPVNVAPSNNEATQGAFPKPKTPPVIPPQPKEPPVAAPQPKEPPKPVQKKSKKKWFLIGGLAVLVPIILIIILLSTCSSEPDYSDDYGYYGSEDPEVVSYFEKLTEIPAYIDLVDEQGNYVLIGSHIRQVIRDYDSDLGAHYFELWLTNDGQTAWENAVAAGTTKKFTLLINQTAVATATTNGNAGVTTHIAFYGNNAFYENSWNATVYYTESEVDTVFSLLQTAPEVVAPEAEPEVEPEQTPAPTPTPTQKPTVKKCAVCGSTSHTKHPTCAVCGSTAHTKHPTCPVCGSTTHTQHPTCPVCGSTAHTTHPSKQSPSDLIWDENFND